MRVFATFHAWAMCLRRGAAGRQPTVYSAVALTLTIVTFGTSLWGSRPAIAAGAEGFPAEIRYLSSWQDEGAAAHATNPTAHAIELANRPFNAPPPGYYDAADGLTGTALRQALHDIVDEHQKLSYDATWVTLALADSFGAPAGMVRTIYRNALRPVDDHTTDGWHREHAWPKSYGFPEDNACNYAFTDAHHLFAVDPSYNSSRNNGIYDGCFDVPGADCDERSVDDHPETPNWRRKGTGEWEVWRGRRGDAARALFYMDVRYEGGPHGIPQCAASGQTEPDLVLTTNLAQIVTKDASPAYMGDLCTLLVWHAQDPVDERESNRNDVVFADQGNRNPFVDHPEWVRELWAPCSEEPALEDPANYFRGFRAYLPATLRSHDFELAAPTLEPGESPTPSASATPSVSPTSPRQTVEPTATPSAVVTESPTVTASATNTLESTATATASSTASATATATVTPSPTATEPAPANLVIGFLQCGTSNEYVRVDNIGGSSMNMAGWDLFSVVGSQNYAFPSYTLDVGASVYVHSGADAPPTSGNHLHWTTAYIWNNDGDTAELKDPSGEVVSEEDC